MGLPGSRVTTRALLLVDVLLGGRARAGAARAERRTRSDGGRCELGTQLVLARVAGTDDDASAAYVWRWQQQQLKHRPLPA